MQQDDLDWHGVTSPKAKAVFGQMASGCYICFEPLDAGGAVVTVSDGQNINKIAHYKCWFITNATDDWEEKYPGQPPPWR